MRRLCHNVLWSWRWSQGCRCRMKIFLLALRADTPRGYERLYLVTEAHLK
jgi:hypothetical protein